MRQYWMLLCVLLLLCLIIPLHAQDNLTPYEIALQRIHEAAATEAIYLDLSYLSLTELPPEIGTLSHIIHLHLNNNGLNSLPPEIGLLTDLKSLVLRHNQLSTLPVEIGHLSSLQELIVNANQLLSVPTEIGQLSDLQVLILGGNQLTNLPREIGQLHNLETLDLNGNQLRNLPPEIGQLSNLCYLYLTENPPLKDLPNELGNLTRLVEDPRCPFYISSSYLDFPPLEIQLQGRGSILAYLRNRARYHVQRLIIGAASGVGLLAVLILGVRYRQHQRKPKAKRG